MGIYSRDYFRDDAAPGGGRWRGVDVIKWLIIVNIAVFVLQVVWQGDVTYSFEHPEYGTVTQTIREPVINQWLALDRRAILGGQVWRLLTYEFLHDSSSPWHLFFNMLFLFFAGRKVEWHYGPREFLLFYLVAGILSGIFTVGWYEALGPPNWSAIGASGAVAAVFIVYALHWPFDTWRIMGIIPVQAMWLAIICAVLDVFPMLAEIGGSDVGDGVAHSAHVGGMLFALVYQRRNWRIEPWFDRLRPREWKRLFKPKTKLRVYHPEAPVDLERRVDELLQKVAEQGEESLTDSERADLMEASRRYRNRGQ